LSHLLYEGHKATNCWDSDRKEDKRPSNYRPTTAGISDKSDDKYKKRLHCTYCIKDGHTIDRCFHKKWNEKNDDKHENADIVMIAIDGKERQNLRKEMSFLRKEDNDIDKVHLRDKYNMSQIKFISDSGATSHMMYSKAGMINLKPWRVPVKVGNAANIYSEMKGLIAACLHRKEVGHFKLHLKMYYTFHVCILNLFL
jgi:hypothetical protein